MSWKWWAGLFLLGFALVAGVPAVTVAITFSRLMPLADDVELPGGTIAVNDGYVAAYLVPLGPHQVVLVDGGRDPEAGTIRRALASHGFMDSDVIAILLTHGHADHTAACAAFPTVPVYAGEAELDLLAGRVAARGPLPRWFGANQSPCASPIGVSDGQLVELAGKTFRAFALPGHTAGSVAWYQDGTLFLGDSADHSHYGEVVSAAWVFADDVAQNRQSLHSLHVRLRQDGVPVKTVAFGHSGPLKEGAVWSRFDPVR